MLQTVKINHQPAPGIMRKFYLLLLSIIMLSCRHSGAPDISGIRVKLELQRFEQDFFVTDSNNISAALPALQQKYPVFLADFIQNILGLSLSDSAEKSDAAIRLFLHDYAIVKKNADSIFKNFDPQKQEIADAVALKPHLQRPAHHDGFYFLGFGEGGFSRIRVFQVVLKFLFAEYEVERVKAEIPARGELQVGHYAQVDTPAVQTVDSLDAVLL